MLAETTVIVKVHPVPTFDNLTALNAVLDRMQELGLYLMYDMRWSVRSLHGRKSHDTN